MARIKSNLHAAILGGTPDDVETAFYEGLQSGDLEKVMACWADEEDIACIHPGGGRLLGAATIRSAFEAMFVNGGSIPVRPEQIHRVDALASAVHHVLERLDLNTPQGPVTAYVLATNVYHKSAQGWRMVVHHASPGSTDAAQNTSQKAKILH